MSNSPLVTLHQDQPKPHQPPEPRIDRITIHCYVGQVTASGGAPEPGSLPMTPLAGPPAIMW